MVIKKKLKDFKRTYTKRKYAKKKQKTTGSILKLIGTLFVLFLIFASIASVLLYIIYIRPLPPVESLKDMEIAESSIIYDKNGNELYKIFKENRTYVEYDQISQNMVNAIVAGEDQRFWTTPGFDVIGITRSILVGVFSGERIGGTSGLSQQLMKVVYLTNERKLERKIKELYLSWKLNIVFSKEKIIELYLNKIEYGSNAFGVEQAAQTFFGKSASELGVLESSILASLPKGPSYYSPYNNPDRLLGYPYVYTEEKPEEQITLLSSSEVENHTEEVSALKDFINALKFKEYNDRILICGVDKTKLKSNIRVDSDGCTIQDYSDLLTFFNSIKIKSDSNIIEYQTGRKDYILGRMLEDEYISFENYRQAILDSIGFSFEKYRENIKYPYFVMYVREYLENKYGKEVLEKGGLKIYTTLNPDYQDKAEELVEKYGAINETKFGAKNAALISLDNESGQIIAMVGGRDYFDVENGGNNNMVTSRLQPGSTFKPFVYSMALAANPIGTKTPVYDLETEFPNYTPKNFDGKFMGKMNISTALNNSRNIPAIKMFYLAGGEKNIVDFMYRLGAETIANFKEEYLDKYGKSYDYGASMALGTGLMTPLELAKSYSVFANMGDKKEITPILKIIDSNGNVIEDYEENKTNKKNQVITEEQAYIINSILSDTTARPSGWNSFLSLPDRPVAAKTGTSTKQYNKGGREVIYPRNIWTVGYTSQYTTVVWGGNTDGTELYYNGNGLEGAGPIWKDFMVYVHKDKPVKNWSMPSKVKKLTVSEVSGLLPNPEGFPENFLIDSLFLNIPNEYDKSLGMIEVDTLCNGKVTSDTPVAAIKKGYLLNFHSLYPDNPKWEGPVQARVATGEYKQKYGNISNIITNYKDEPCDRGTPGNIVINSNYKDGEVLFVGSNYIEVAYKSTKNIKKLEILLGDNVIYELNTLGKTSLGKRIDFNIPDHFANSKQELTIRAVDNDYYSGSQKVSIVVGAKDTIAPDIELDSIGEKITLTKGETLDITGKIIDSSSIRSVNFYLDNNPLKLGLKDREFTYTIDSTDLEKGNYIFKIEAYDFNFNQAVKEIDLVIR
ncbi:MAG: transglycosylase domain-containing protein [Candidatus Gracilibacteria bacterium]|nr:transglycosylase domain-containing protein [Candidatus Gracilibacteria bacterium]